MLRQSSEISVLEAYPHTKWFGIARTLRPEMDEWAWRRWTFHDLSLDRDTKLCGQQLESVIVTIATEVEWLQIPVVCKPLKEYDVDNNAFRHLLPSSSSCLQLVLRLQAVMVKVRTEPAIGRLLAFLLGKSTHIGNIIEERLGTTLKCRLKEVGMSISGNVSPSCLALVSDCHQQSRIQAERTMRDLHENHGTSMLFVALFGPLPWRVVTSRRTNRLTVILFALWPIVPLVPVCLNLTGSLKFWETRGLYGARQLSCVVLST